MLLNKFKICFANYRYFRFFCFLQLLVTVILGILFYNKCITYYLSRTIKSYSIKYIISYYNNLYPYYININYKA